MLPSQKAAIDRYITELSEALKRETPVLFHYMESRNVISFEVRELIVRESRFSSEEVTSLLHVLKETDSGLFNLLCYLSENNHTSLADKIQKEVVAANQSSIEVSKRSALEKFSARIAAYYQLHYANLPTMGESPKHVEDVWVPLQIDGRSESHLAADRIDHIELLKRLQTSRGRNNGLIKGHPGMGKTTLVKKIAYDWAKSYDSNAAQPFKLVLAVPLRFVGKANRFDLLAIDYFLSILDVSGINESELREEIGQLQSHLLVILDGLDEYRCYEEGPFKAVFAAPFQHASVSCNMPPPSINFKLIITSRPYACERVNEEFWPLRYVVLPLDANHLDQFVRLYCQTSYGVAKVTEYLERNAKLVIQVPLILTFICYLADSVQEIPTNMTSLYDSFIRQMLRRENWQKKLAQPVNIEKWKEADVVKTTSQLAYLGITEKKRLVRSDRFVFTKEHLERCLVTNDSFICGFLLHRFDFAKERLMSEFPHRSIQEFFVALHCYQQMLSGHVDVLRDVNRLILTEDSQFGRFLFGICSIEGQFEQMANWLSPSLIPTGLDCCRLATTVNRLGDSLIDCSADENRRIGQTLFETVGELREKIVNVGVRHTNFPLTLDSLSDEFKEALHLGTLTTVPGSFRSRIYDWFLSDCQNVGQLVVAYNKLPELLDRKFDLINVLVLEHSGMDRKTIFSQIKNLPPVITLVINAAASSLLISVVVHIRYARDWGSQLTCFRMQYVKDDADERIRLVERDNRVDLTVDEVGQKGDDFTTRQLLVTVNDPDVSQSSLIFSLIRLSLQ